MICGYLAYLKVVDRPMTPATPTDTGTEMETVTSADGTEIAYERTGSGSPLVLVHGVVCDHGVWDARGLRSPLAEQFTVYAMDRRGHGESGDGDPYEIERVFEDVVAVVEAIDEPVTLFGHSSGGLYALGAARRTDNVRQVVLYEPFVPRGDEETEQTIREAITLLEEGKPEEALVLLLREGAHFSPEEMDFIRSVPYWEKQVKLMQTVPLEFQALSEYEFDPDQFVEMTTPTLLLSGSESPHQYKEEIDLLDDTLPNSRVVTIDGVGHIVTANGPERFIDEILGFVQESN